MFNSGQGEGQRLKKRPRTLTMKHIIIERVSSTQQGSCLLCQFHRFLVTSQVGLIPVVKPTRPELHHHNRFVPLHN